MQRNTQRIKTYARASHGSLNNGPMTIEQVKSKMLQTFSDAIDDWLQSTIAQDWISPCLQQHGPSATRGHSD